MRSAFSRFAQRASVAMGSPWTFTGYLLLVVLWIGSGFVLHFSDTWQLVANTFTTLVTTALVLLVQHTQNTTDEKVLEKLDALLERSKGDE